MEQRADNHRRNLDEKINGWLRSRHMLHVSIGNAAEIAEIDPDMGGTHIAHKYLPRFMGIQMLRNFFRKCRLGEDGKSDAGHVQERDSSSLANLDQAGTRVEQADEAGPSTDKDRWADQRAPEKPGDRILSLDAMEWLRSLPGDVTPYDLVQRYPRICNRITERRKYPDLMIHFFDALLMDGRGGRKGFPPTVAIEIAALREHYQTVFATKEDAWDRVIASRMFF